MRLQNMQQAAVPGSYRQLHDALREHPAVSGLRELDRASQDAMDLPQPRVPRVRESHARRGEVAVRRPIQRSDDSQRDKLGKLLPRLVVPADWAHSQYGFTFLLRDFEVDCFVRRFRISRQVFESFRDRRRSRGKVEKDTSVSQIYLRPRREARGENRSSRSRPILGTEAAT